MYDQHVSQRKLADRTGMSQPGIYRRLSGEVDFSVPEIRAVAIALDVPVAHLLGEAVAA